MLSGSLSLPRRWRTTGSPCATVVLRRFFGNPPTAQKPLLPSGELLSVPVLGSHKPLRTGLHFDLVSQVVAMSRWKEASDQL